MEYEFIVVGGGLVGSAVAYGLAGKGCRVRVLDEGDRAFRASRGNFGLVWVQGKGWDFPSYAKWSNSAANLWPEFNQELSESSGVDTGYTRPGGLELYLSETKWENRSQEMAQIRQHVGDQFEYEMLDHAALKKLIPQIGKDVVGASYSPQDGHVNPLYLLRALHQQMDAKSVSYRPNEKVDNIEYLDGEFIVHTQTGTHSAAKIVLCAGLDNQRLGAMLDMQVPVTANRGQILITERAQPFLHYPTLHVRQTQEGSLQIGDSHEEVGLNDGTSVEIMAMIARRAVRLFPLLARMQLVRAWGALRIMTPDGKPVYQSSQSCPGAFAIATHSGVSLVAAHAGPIVDWMMGIAEHPLISHFSTVRFDINADTKGKGSCGVCSTE